MNINKSFDLIEYLSLFLVFSFLIFHNIYLVLAGIIFSLTAINRNFLINFISLISKKKSNKAEIPLESIIIQDKKEIESNNVNNSISLAESVEELGFIPSAKNNDDIFAA
tara:strand:+ start:247 stop:576 length:330 start_codon:yes stop_codon:yes gene_type:complete